MNTSAKMNTPAKFDFRYGFVSPDLAPVQLLREEIVRVAQETEDISLYNYGEVGGTLEQRKSVAKFIQELYGVEIDAQTVFMTSGNTSSLSMLCKLLLGENRFVLAENPTYFGALSVFKDFRVQVVRTPELTGAEAVDKVAELLQETNLHNALSPAFFYLNPTLQNPTGRTLSVVVLKKLAELADVQNFYLVADEPYFWFSEESEILDFMLHCERVIWLGSFSKLLAASLRLGCLICNNKSIFQGVVNLGEHVSQGGQTPFGCLVLSKMLDSGSLGAHTKIARLALNHRSSVMKKVLDSFFSNDVLSFESGGFFVWCTLGSTFKEYDIDCFALYPLLKKEEFDFLPGTLFDPEARFSFRLSCSYLPIDDLFEGLRVLSNVLSATVESITKKGRQNTNREREEKQKK